MKSLLEFINENIDTKAETHVEVSVDSVAEENNVSVGDINKVVKYIKNNNPSWQTISVDTMAAAGVPERAEDADENTEPNNREKVLDAVKQLKDGGFFDKKDDKDKEDSKDDKSEDSKDKE